MSVSRGTRVRNRTRKEIEREEAEMQAAFAAMMQAAAAPSMGTLVVGAHDHDGLTDWTLTCSHGYTEVTTVYSIEPQAQLTQVAKAHRTNHAKNSVLCLCAPTEGMTVEP